MKLIIFFCLIFIACDNQELILVDCTLHSYKYPLCGNKNYIYISSPVELMTVHEGNVLEKRSKLINYIFGSSGLPTTIPASVTTNITDSRYSDLNNLERIDKLIINMSYSLNSVSYHFIPVNKKNVLILYHQGHKGDFVNGKHTINYFLSRGYAVLAFSMPLLGLNSQGSFGTDHNNFAHLEKKRNVLGYSTIKFFTLPVISCLNYISTHFTYTAIHMVGLSGGGWTTMIVSAMDTRINKSFPVAGGYPFYLRNAKDIGDFEQSTPSLYNKANFLDLFYMASYEPGKSQIQIFNRYDACCFAGTYALGYSHVINGGKLKVLIDVSHGEHMISDWALKQIIKKI